MGIHDGIFVDLFVEHVCVCTWYVCGLHKDHVSGYVCGSGVWIMISSLVIKLSGQVCAYLYEFLWGSCK